VHGRLGAGGLGVGTVLMQSLGLVRLGCWLLLLLAAAGNWLLRALLGPRAVPVMGFAKISLALGAGL
jgi:hypothetical protein